MSEAAKKVLGEIERADMMMRAGQPQETATILKAVLPEIKDRDPGYRADIYSKLGTAYALSKRHKKAVECFLKAIDLDETLVKAYQNLCLSYTRLDEIEKAIEYGEKGLEYGPESPELLKAVLNAKRLAWEVEEALEMIENSPAFDENDPFLLLNHGTLLYETGQKKKSHDVFEKALEIYPGYVKAHRMFSLVHKYTPDDPHIKKLHAFESSQDLSAEEVGEIDFALAKAYEDLGAYETAFKYYKQGNDQKRGMEPFSHLVEEAFFNQVKEVFTPQYVESFRQRHKIPAGPVTPVFIIGMPRSGTSLTEQILSSHTNVFGAGELTDLDRLQFEKFSLQRGDFKNTWQNIGEKELKEIVELYYQRLTRDSAGEEFITDKMPLNFIHVGVILCLFPHAKIIHCRRDPRATCFSIFKTYFTGAVAFANNQKDLARYYKLYEGMIAHWKTVMPGAIYETQYEALVENPEPNIRALLQYCGLEWQEACLDFHKTKRAVVTASAMQVRKPMYKDAMAYWKNFEPYMDPELLELGKDYESSEG